MSLATLQDDMSAWLRGDELAAERFGPNASAGLDVYQNNFRAQLVASLSETFARVKAWLGDEAFLSCVIAHIQRSPPNDWTLDNYGRDFPLTLRGLYPSDPEIAELAWLDRALADAFVAPDARPIDTKSLDGVDWDRVSFGFSPTLRHEQITTNSTAIWSALSAAIDPPAVERIFSPAEVIVWRKHWTSCFRIADATESNALAAALAGATFGELCSTLIESLGEEAGVRLAGTYLARWLQDELIVDVISKHNA